MCLKTTIFLLFFKTNSHGVERSRSWDDNDSIQGPASHEDLASPVNPARCRVADNCLADDDEEVEVAAVVGLRMGYTSTDYTNKPTGWWR